MAGLNWNDEEVAQVGEGVLSRTLPEPEWTHQAHFAALVHLLRDRPEIDLDRHLPRIIWRYNIAVGTPNNESRGYHETITRFYLMAVRVFLARLEDEAGPGTIVTRLVNSAFGQVGFPLRYYERDVLQWVEPDLAPFDFETCPMEPDDAMTDARWKAARKAQSKPI
jgi:hypothetical protein